MATHNLTVVRETLQLLPWVTGRVSTTVRVEYTGAQTVQVQVFPCYRLTNPTSVRMFTRTPLSLQSPAYEPDGPVNGAAEVNLLQSPGLSPPPLPDGVEAWGTIRLFTGCSCFNQPKAGGLALFSNIGKLLTPPALPGARWPTEVTFSPQDIGVASFNVSNPFAGVTLIAQTSCCNSYSTAVGVGAEWFPAPEPTTFADDMSALLLFPFKVGVGIMFLAVGFLVLGCFMQENKKKSNKDNDDPNPCCPCFKCMMALGTFVFFVGICIIWIMCTTLSAIVLCFFIGIVVGLAGANKNCEQCVVGGSARRRRRASAAGQSKRYCCTPKCLRATGRVCLGIAIVFARSSARFLFDLARVRVQSSLIGVSYTLGMSGWVVIPPVLLAPLHAVLPSLVDTWWAVVKTMRGVTAGMLGVEELLTWLSGMNCPGPASTAIAGVAMATSGVLVYVCLCVCVWCTPPLLFPDAHAPQLAYHRYLLGADFFAMLAAQASRSEPSTKHSRISSVFRQLPDGLQKLLVLLATAMTVGVPAAATSIFTLPFKTEEGCAEDWDPLLSFVSRCVGFVVIAAAVCFLVAYVLHVRLLVLLRPKLQQPLAQTLHCKVMEVTPEELKRPSALAHLQVFAGVWGSTAEEEFHLAARGRCYATNAKSGGDGTRAAVRQAIASATGASIALAMLCVPYTAVLATMYASTSLYPLVLSDLRRDSPLHRRLAQAVWAASVLLGLTALVLGIQSSGFVGDAASVVAVVVALARGVFAEVLSLTTRPPDEGQGDAAPGAGSDAETGDVEMRTSNPLSAMGTPTASGKVTVQNPVWQGTTKQ